MMMLERGRQHAQVDVVGGRERQAKEQQTYPLLLNSLLEQLLNLKVVNVYLLLLSFRQVGFAKLGEEE